MRWEWGDYVFFSCYFKFRHLLLQSKLIINTWDQGEQRELVEGLNSTVICFEEQEKWIHLIVEVIDTKTPNALSFWGFLLGLKADI